MVFSNLVFIFVFLPLVLFFYYIVKDTFKNIILLIASLVFYAWGEPQYVFLMLFSILLNYFFGLGIHRYRNSLKIKKTILILSIVVNIAILGYFKYSGFLIDNLNEIFGTKWSIGELPLPIGISFFTFQSMSYVIDVYRNDAKVQKNIFSLALYVTLFPQLVAGPIVRYNDIEEQIQSRSINLEKFNEGIKRFIIGLSKKVLLANGFASIADTIFGTPTGELSVLTAWMGITAYTLQIYFDFSGYSDMAIGLGKMFGFDFLENFNYPYISKSVSEFWRRWHISLGSWFRDYLYIPLGGNRKGTIITLRNLLIVWTVTGLWHGASWTFMAWGFYYGILISLERFGFLRFVSKLWAPLQHLYVVLIVMVGWVFFRADNFTYSVDYLKTMFGFSGSDLYDNTFILFAHDNWFLFLIGIVFSTPILSKLTKIEIKNTNSAVVFRSLFESATYMIMLILVMIYLVNSTYNPFIYFRF
ncbi:MBOAT family O-acyltransferase [Thermaerobacillus caldiproteolyticus]|uniref:MBOAT family O-acyltransferase n=1 Tax=Thermaerobacillus caldiproteolyticus TaxID=247480 RepID=UPI00188B0054|nr:MBOAT family protein [Anoxybacillus caldiproteolyticus]QPA30482.1 MBOAT family protein [Anoxybacillus caldiproteolyticus]